MKIGLCIPIIQSAQISPSFLINFINRLGELDPSKYDIAIYFSMKSPLEKSREELVKFALAGKCDYIWFIDTDMVIVKGTIDTLLGMIKDDVMVASTLYFQKGIPYHPTTRKFDEEGEYAERLIEPEEFNQIIEVDGVGMGCALINTKIFEKIDKPYFRWIWEGEELKASEDLYFCRKVRKAGFKILVNTGVTTGHYGGLVTEREYLNYRDLK